MTVLPQDTSAMATENLTATRCPPAQKIRSVAELGVLAERARSNGRTVVHSHGVFDLLHFGHLRHLEAAHRLGDVLIVTITADRYVNKGPGRPVFPAQVRAEMLAALEIVDWVAVNDAPLAAPVLETVKPDIYVKGSDYAQAQNDITGGISVEQQVVESHGGRLVFTDEETYSSSSLINKYLAIYDPEVEEYLRVMRERNVLGEILDLIDKVKDFRVLIVGDAIIDEYQYVQPMAKAPKENLIATLYRDRELFAGGVIAAANHIASFCGQVDVVTVLGTADSHADLILSRLKPNVHMKALQRKGAPTTRKCRFVDHVNVRKLFEVYFMDETPLERRLEAELKDYIAECAADYDLVLVTDFGHGLITPGVIQILEDKARFLAVNAQTNSANYGYNLISRYRRADYVCIDAPEARLATRDKFSDIAEVTTKKMPALVDCKRFIITHGAHGCVTYQAPQNGKPKDFRRIPAFTKTVVDTIGAGDAFLAVTSPLAAIGAPMDLVGFIGNAAGAIKVGIVGHRQSIEKASLVKFVTALLK
jgi:rfaE bifunctional protein nucleotidyltransferase chain/domain